jgi:hypothetical protein
MDLPTFPEDFCNETFSKISKLDDEQKQTILIKNEMNRIYELVNKESEQLLNGSWVSVQFKLSNLLSHTSKKYIITEIVNRFPNKLAYVPSMCHKKFQFIGCCHYITIVDDDDITNVRDYVLNLSY